MCPHHAALKLFRHRLEPARWRRFAPLLVDEVVLPLRVPRPRVREAAVAARVVVAVRVERDRIFHRADHLGLAHVERQRVVRLCASEAPDDVAALDVDAAGRDVGRHGVRVADERRTDDVERAPVRRVLHVDALAAPVHDGVFVAGALLVDRVLLRVREKSDAARVRDVADLSSWEINKAIIFVHANENPVV